MTEGTLSLDDITNTAREFGYTYSDLEVTRGALSGPVFEGRIGFLTLPVGIGLCASDLRTLRRCVHEGQVDPSLSVAIGINGAPVECLFGSNHRLNLSAGGAALVAAADNERLASEVPAAGRNRGMLLRVRSEDLADETVADLVDKATRKTSVKPIAAPGRAAWLANELLDPSLTGGIARLMIESASLEILAVALAQDGAMHSTDLNPTDHRKLKRVQDALHAHPDHDFSLSELARVAGMSLASLKDKFPRAFGLPVFVYLRDLRLNRARMLLEQGGWSVAEAAYHSGYRHQSNFATAYRRKFGVAPSVHGRNGRHRA
ncbi:MAG: AraC family transcriptional regulator [Pseudomonadota bacterium]